jgi:hypothetical protein
MAGEGGAETQRVDTDLISKINDSHTVLKMLKIHGKEQ